MCAPRPGATPREITARGTNRPEGRSASGKIFFRRKEKSRESQKARFDKFEVAGRTSSSLDTASRLRSLLYMTHPSAMTHSHTVTQSHYSASHIFTQSHSHTVTQSSQGHRHVARSKGVDSHPARRALLPPEPHGARARPEEDNKDGVERAKGDGYAGRVGRIIARLIKSKVAASCGCGSCDDRERGRRL